MPEISPSVNTISNSAKLLGAYMKATGITCAKTIAQTLDIPIRTIQRLKLECATCANSATDGAAKCANDATGGVSEPTEQVAPACENNSTRDCIENPTDLSSVDDTHTGARVGERHLGHGVFLNCETIRHARFTISLPAVEMQFALGGIPGTKSEIAEKARDASIAAALQWGAAIENGGNWREVVPGNIPGAIRGGMQSMQWRGEVAKSKAAAPATKFAVPYTQNVIRIASRQEVGHDA